MTEIKSHLAAALGDEPPMVDDLDAVMSTGRRLSRRRTTITAIASTAGVAALTAAVVVPIAASSGGGQPTKVVSDSTPAAKVPHKCKSYFVAAPAGASDAKAIAQARAKVSRPGEKTYVSRVKHDGGKHLEVVSNCPNPLKATKGADSGPTGPKYHYTESPTTIAGRLASKLSSDVSARHLTVVYSSPFAQESSTLEKGHPSYYDGNVDVRVGSTLGDIGVQVNHPTTTQQAFNGKCDGTGFAKCQRTTLADGAILQTDQVKVGHGTYIVEADESRPDGTLVHVQESNYAFGPEAGKSHGNQPLPLSALVAMAEDSAYGF